MRIRCRSLRADQPVTHKSPQEVRNWLERYWGSAGEGKALKQETWTRDGQGPRATSFPHTMCKLDWRSQNTELMSLAYHILENESSGWSKTPLHYLNEFVHAFHLFSWSFRMNRCNLPKPFMAFRRVSASALLSNPGKSVTVPLRTWDRQNGSIIHTVTNVRKLVTPTVQSPFARC